MALIKCPECGREVSDKASACIHCGYSLRRSAFKEHKKEIKTLCICSGIMIILAAVLLITFLSIIPSCQRKAAEKLDEKILSIGQVELADEEIITECREEYDGMGARTKERVQNIKTLESAEKELEHIISIHNDKTAPQIFIPETGIKLNWMLEATESDILSALSFSDDVSPSASIEVTVGDVDTSTCGESVVNITAKDEAGNVTTESVPVLVESKYSRYILIALNEARYGISEIKDHAKIPSSIAFYGIRMKDNKTYFYFTAQNSFGANIDYYARANWDAIGIFGNDFYWPTDNTFQRLLEDNYDDGDELFTIEEYNEFVNSPYAELSREEIIAMPSE